MADTKDIAGRTIIDREQADAVNKLIKERRKLAVQAVLGGDQIRATARALSIDAKALRKWVRLARRGGIGALENIGYMHMSVGRPRHLSPQQLDALKVLMAAPASTYGIEADRWTYAAITTLIKNVFDKEVSRDTVWIIRKEMGLPKLGNGGLRKRSAEAEQRV